MDTLGESPSASMQDILQELATTMGRLEGEIKQIHTSQTNTTKQIALAQAKTTKDIETAQKDTKQLIDTAQTATTDQLNKIESALATTQSEMQQIKDNEVQISEKITQLEGKLHSLDIHIDEKIQVESERIKDEMKEHIKQEILLSEGVMNVYTQQKIEQAVKNAQVQTNTKIKEVDLKVEEVAQIVNDQCQQLSDRLIMQEERVIPGTSMGRMMTHIPRSIEDKIPTFADDKNSSPYAFILELESYLKMNHVVPRLHINIISHMMQGKCKDWFHAYQECFTNLEAFKKLFLSKYCNEDKQFYLRERLLKAKYHGKSGHTMTQHFLIQMVHNKNMKESFPEKQFLQIVLRHFDVRTQQIILARNIQSCNDFERILEQLDQIQNTENNKTEPVKNDTKPKENLQNQGAVNKPVNNPRYTPYQKPQKNPAGTENKHISVLTNNDDSKNELSSGSS